MRSLASRQAVALFVLGVTLVTQEVSYGAPTDPERRYNTDRFTITWVHDPTSRDAPSLRDRDGNGIPDSVEQMGRAFEESRARLLGEFSYRPPPVTGRYQIYIAQGEGRGYIRPAPGDTDRSRASFIVLPPFFARSTTTLRTIRGIAVHEYFHAIQMGYDWLEPLWFDEATASWIQDVVFDADNTNHHLLADFVPYPRRSLTDSDGRREYGAFLFVQFLMERYGGTDAPAIVREMWELMAVPESIPGSPDLDVLGALQAVLEERGSTVAEAWREFLVWRWRLGHFEEGRSYRSALADAPWPNPLRSSVVDAESCRLTTDTDSVEPLPRLSGDYVRLRPGRTVTGAHDASLVVTGPPGSVGTALVKRARGEVAEFPLAFDLAGMARVDLAFGGDQATQVTLALGNGALQGPPVELAYSLHLAGRSATVVSPVFGPETNIFGEGIYIDGTVSCGGHPAPQAHVRLIRTEVSSGTEHVVELVTDQLGRWSEFVAPTVNSTYRIELADPHLTERSSPEKRVDVAVGVALVPATEQLRLGDPLEVAGVVSPAHPGVGVVLEFRRPERPWRLALTTTTDAEGRFDGSVSLPAEGFWEVRARVLATDDLDHVPGVSLAHLIEVR